MTDDIDPKDHIRERRTEWRWEAYDNLSKWGLQPEATLLLAMMEELGELAQAHLEHEHAEGDRERIQDELDDLMALGVQFYWSHADQNPNENPRFAGRSERSPQVLVERKGLDNVSEVVDVLEDGEGAWFESRPDERFYVEVGREGDYGD